jgi:hypothetical protein
MREILLAEEARCTSACLHQNNYFQVNFSSLCHYMTLVHLHFYFFEYVLFFPSFVLFSDATPCIHPTEMSSGAFTESIKREEFLAS